MTSNFTKLSIVTAIFLGLASYSVLKNKDSNLFSERGNTFIENLPSKLNDIQKIKITGRDLDMELINKNNSFIEKNRCTPYRAQNKSSQVLFHVSNDIAPYSKNNKTSL